MPLPVVSCPQVSGISALVGAALGALLTHAFARIRSGKDKRTENIRLARNWEYSPDNYSLAGLDFHRCDLQRVNLSPAPERQGRIADLTGATLTRADLRGALLKSAILDGAKLRWADLRNVDLTDAILTNSDLRDANLRGAILDGANISGAKIAGAAVNNDQLDRTEGDSRSYAIR